VGLQENSSHLQKSTLQITGLKTQLSICKSPGLIPSRRERERERKRERDEGGGGEAEKEEEEERRKRKKTKSISIGNR
jgi:hypothetical protein